MLKIKKGTLHPNNEKIDISTWKGSYNKTIDNGKDILVCLDLDKETINNMSKEYIHYCKNNNLNHTQIWIKKSKIENL